MRYLVTIFLLIAAAVAFSLPSQASLEADMFDPVQFKTEVVVPTLSDMEVVFPGAMNDAAANLMVGIVFHESHGGTYLRQKANSGGIVENGGLGICQIESATHQDTYNTYLAYYSDRLAYARDMLPVGSVLRVSKTFYEVDDAPLIHNMRYAVFIARTHIYRQSFSWPEDPADIAALGKIWDDKYNRNPDAGFVHQFVRDFPRKALEA
jgi:hypothetical protein